MTEQQLELGVQVAVVEPPVVLTEQQQAVLEHVASCDGATASEVGRAAHSVRGPRGGRAHSPDRQCDYCERTGRRVADGLVDLGLVRRRKGEPGAGYLYVLAAAPGGPGRDDRPGPGDLPDGF